MSPEYINNNQVSEPMFTSVPDENIMQSAPQPQYQVNSSRPPRKTKLKIILITILGVIIFGGVAYGGYYVYQNIWPNNPDSLFWQALANFNMENRMSVDGSLSFTLTTLQSSSTTSAFNVFSDLVSGSDQQKGSLKFSSKYDRTDVNNILADSEFTVNFSEISFRLLARMIGKNLYFKVTDQNLSVLGELFSIPDSWVQVDINQQQQELLSQSGSLNGAQSAISINDVFKIIRETQPFQIELLEKNDESFGQQAYIYKVIWSRQGFDKMLQDLVAAVPDEQRQKLLAERLQPLTDDEWNRLSSTEIKIWILKKDKMLRQMSFHYNRNEVNIEQNIDVTLLIAMQALQQPLKVEVPTDAISLEDLMKQMFSTLFSDSNIEQQNNYQVDARRIADIKQIQTALELYYNDYNRYPNSSGNAIKLGDSNNTCLSGDLGFGFSCSGMTYMGNVPNDPEFPKYYYNYLSDGNNYLLEFYIAQDVGNIKSGVNYASNKGISSDWKKVQSINGGTPSGVYVPLDNNQNDDFSKLLSPTDKDNDQLDDLQEVVYGTNPLNPDTDGDGYLDGEEIQNGYNPLGEGKI